MQNLTGCLEAAWCVAPWCWSADAYAYIWRDFYLISTGGGRVYLLDGLQKSYERDNPYSSFQYECYVWENVPARVFWEDAEGRLCFGDASARLYVNMID